MKKLKKILGRKNNLFITVSCILGFALLAVVYCNPVFEGKELLQPDIIHYKGGAKELLDYREKYDNETYWSDSMFGGMPTYQIGAKFEADLIKKLDNALNFLPRPTNYLFLIFSGFFFLGMVCIGNWKYALSGALFFGLSTYFYIIIAVGHNSKVSAIAYFAPLLAGILQVFIRKKYLSGFIIVSIFMGLEVAVNHPQMTYYLFMAFGIFWLSELYRSVFKTKKYRHFGISTLVVGIAMVLGIGMNSQRLMTNMEYVKETVRGKQILGSNVQREKSGLDKESLTNWSYGKLETLNLFIPRIMGGGSQEQNSEKIGERVQEILQENRPSSSEMNNISRAFRSFTYWGDQPGTSGPAYQGAVVIFLTFLGFFFVERRYRWWIVASSILAIMLAWGKNFMPLTDLFIEFVPMYNKFRAPSSILVVVEFLFPFVAILGIYRLFTDKNISATYKQKIILYVSSGILVITMLLIFFGKYFMDFCTSDEEKYFPKYLLDYLVDIRFSLFRTDALKALLFVSITACSLYLFLQQKLSENKTLIIIGLLSIIDLWSVNRQYFNNDNFVDKIFSENPFITEVSEFLQKKAGNNSYVQALLQQAPVNNILQNIAQKDSARYRVFNTVLGSFNETNTSYFVSSVGGYSAVKLRRYDDLINKYLVYSINPEILNLLNVKYVITSDETGQLKSMINPETNGNAWFVSEIKFVDSPDEELEYLGKINSKKTAVVNISDKNYFSERPLSADPKAKLKLKNQLPNEIEFISESQTSQLAIFSEIYYPHGWKMFIDGKETPYVKADYLLRALYVPSGKHEIKMIFRPETIEKGKVISYASLGCFLLLSTLGFYKFRMKKSD